MIMTFSLRLIVIVSTSIYNADLLPLGKVLPYCILWKETIFKRYKQPSQSDYGLARVPLVPKSTSPQKLAFASHFMHYPGQWVTPKAYSWPRIDKGRTRFDSPIIQALIHLDVLQQFI